MQGAGAIAPAVQDGARGFGTFGRRAFDAMPFRYCFFGRVARHPPRHAAAERESGDDGPGCIHRPLDAGVALLQLLAFRVAWASASWLLRSLSLSALSGLPSPSLSNFTPCLLFSRATL